MVPVDTEGIFPNANDNAAMRALEELEGTRSMDSCIIT